jgi:hypothetical protein
LEGLFYLSATRHDFQPAKKKINFYFYDGMHASDGRDTKVKRSITF